MSTFVPMNNFSISATKNTPSVIYSSTEHLLAITGKSYPEDARSFYLKVTDQVNQIPNLSALTIKFDFEYLSSSSVACILQFLKDIRIQHESCLVKLEMLHDLGDDDMISVGDNFSQLSGFSIELIPR